MITLPPSPVNPRGTPLYVLLQCTEYKHPVSCPGVAGLLFFVDEMFSKVAYTLPSGRLHTRYSSTAGAVFNYHYGQVIIVISGT